MSIAARLQPRLGALLLLGSLAALGWALWPVAYDVEVQPLRPENLLLPVTTAGTSTSAQAAPAGIVEPRWLRLERPRRLLAGRPQVVRLTLALEGDRSSATAPREWASGVGGAEDVSDVFETHNVVAAASLRVAGFTLQPAGELAKPLLPGQPASFIWRVVAPQGGSYRGTIMLRLRFLPKAGGEPLERALWVQAVQWQADTLIGMSRPDAAWLGVLGLAIGSILVVPWLKEVHGWLWKKEAHPD